jgi:hypothetical protein
MTAHLGDPLAHNYIRNLLDDSNVAAPKGGVTNDVRIYGDGDITVTKTVDGAADRPGGWRRWGGGGGGSFSGIKDPAGTGVVVDGLGWILTTDDNVVNVAASGANTLAFSVNQAGITHNNLAGLTTGHPHAQYPLLSGSETVTGLWSYQPVYQCALWGEQWGGGGVKPGCGQGGRLPPGSGCADDGRTAVCGPDGERQYHGDGHGGWVGAGAGCRADGTTGYFLD